MPLARETAPVFTVVRLGRIDNDLYITGWIMSFFLFVLFVFFFVSSSDASEFGTPNSNATGERGGLESSCDAIKHRPARLCY